MIVGYNTIIITTFINLFIEILSKSIYNIIFRLNAVKKTRYSSGVYSPSNYICDKTRTEAPYDQRCGHSASGLLCDEYTYNMCQMWWVRKDNQYGCKHEKWMKQNMQISWKSTYVWAVSTWFGPKYFTVSANKRQHNVEWSASTLDEHQL